MNEAILSIRHKDSEEQVLAGLITDPGLFGEVIDILEPDDFAFASNQALYRIIMDLAERDELDAVRVAQRARTDMGFDPLKVSDMLANLTVPKAAITHAQRVHDAAVLRRIRVLGSDMIEQAGKAEARVDEILDHAGTELYALESGASRQIAWPTLLSQALTDVEYHYQKGEVVTGIPTSLMSLDYATGGFQPSWLVFVAARPGVGKTAYVLQAGVTAAREGYKVLISSLEMSGPQLAQRVLCGIAGVSYSKVRHNQLENQDFTRLVNAEASLAELPITIVDDACDTLAALQRRVKRFRPDLLIVDYVQLMRHPKAEHQEAEIAAISGGLKSMAKRYGIVVLAACQLNRESEKRADKRPSMGDLRGSGRLEQDADLLWLLHRPEGDTRVCFDRVKFRHGPSGEDWVHWLPELTKFIEYG